MKARADKHHIVLEFQVDEWVNLKLQPYRLLSVLERNWSHTFIVLLSIQGDWEGGSYWISFRADRSQSYTSCIPHLVIKMSNMPLALHLTTFSNDLWRVWIACPICKGTKHFWRPLMRFGCVDSMIQPTNLWKQLRMRSIYTSHFPNFHLEDKVWLESIGGKIG